MTFACIGWGSLIWQPKDLPVCCDWFHDGPVLPLEFARHSGQKGGEDRLTLVLLESGTPIRTRWARLNIADIDEARRKLREREGCNLKDIGYWPNAEPGAYGKIIGDWAMERKLEGVVWTDLPPKFGGDERMPTLDEAISFLANLPEKQRQLSEEYVRNAPLVVRTPYREAFEEKFGWTPNAKD